MSRLGGVVVSVLATGPKGCGFEPGQGDGKSHILFICSEIDLHFWYIFL
jgi:hypothetical protein